MNQITRQRIADGSLLMVAVLSGISVVASRGCQFGGTSKTGEEGPIIPALAEVRPHSIVFNRDGRTVRVASSSSTPNESPTWVVERPWKRAAELATVDAAITALRDMQVVRTLPIDTNVSREQLQRLGLDTPHFGWQVEVDGSVWSFSFGAEAPAPRGGTYVDVSAPGSQAHKFYVVSVDLAKLSLLPEQLLEPRLVPYVPSDFSEVTLESGSHRMSLHFDDVRSRWFETDGQHYRSSRAALDHLFADITTLRGEHFLTPEESVKKALGQKVASVKLTLTKSNATIRLDFSGRCEGKPTSTFVVVSGQEKFAACANAGSLLAELERDTLDVADTQLFSLRADEVESVKTRRGGRSFQLERWESGFRIAGSNARSVDLETGNRWLQALLATRGRLVRNPTSVALPAFDDNELVQLRSAVVGPHEQFEEVVHIGSPLPNGDRFIKRGADGAVLRMVASDLAPLELDDSKLAAEKALPPDAGSDSLDH